MLSIKIEIRIKSMEIIARNLPVNQEYEIINFYSGECICENCGRFIKNICEIKGKNDKKIYIVGTECADRLQGIEPSEIKEIKRKLNKTNKIKKILIEKEFKTGIALVEYDYEYIIYSKIVWNRIIEECKNWDVNYIARFSKEYFEKNYKEFLNKKIATIYKKN